MSKTRLEAHQELNIASKKLLYEVCKSLKIIWLVDKIPFLTKRQWVLDIEKDLAPNPTRSVE